MKNIISTLVLALPLAMAAQTPNGAAYIGLSSGANSNLIPGNI